MDTLPFEAALAELKQGKRLTRAAWDSPDCFIAINHFGKDVPAEDLWTAPIREHLLKRGYTHGHVEGNIMMLGWGNKVMTWVCTPTDLLATDWLVLD